MPTQKLVTPSETIDNTRGDWLWSQGWRHLLFAHWQVPADQLRPLVPGGLELDTWEGQAWLSVVAFHLQGVRLRWLPPLGPCSNFVELNLRTYVHGGNEPAIYFLSIHANGRLAVRLARWLTPLPYAFARIGYRRRSNLCSFQSHLSTDNGPLFQAKFEVPRSPPQLVGDSLDGWLLERYCAYTTDHRGRLQRFVVEHAPWQVSVVNARVNADRLGALQGLDLTSQPHRCHFSDHVEALLWPAVVAP